MSRLHFLTPMLLLEKIICSIVRPFLYIINVHKYAFCAGHPSVGAHALLFPQDVATPVIGAALMPAAADVAKLLGFTFQGPDGYRDRYAFLLGRAARGLVEMRAHVIRAAVFGFIYVVYPEWRAQRERFDAQLVNSSRALVYELPKKPVGSVLQAS